MVKTPGKKAFMRTLEAVMAMAITLIFVALFALQFDPAKSRPQNENILEVLSKDDFFRSCITTENSTCINKTLRTHLQQYDYPFNISSNPNEQAGTLPAKKIFSESIFVSGNTTLYKPRILRIYYWGR